MSSRKRKQREEEQPENNSKKQKTEITVKKNSTNIFQYFDFIHTVANQTFRKINNVIKKFI